MESRKEMIRRYKEMKTPMGIVMIKNSVNNKVFIDATTDTKNVIVRTRFQLKMGSHRVKEMQKDWTQYGEEAFSFEVLEALEYDEKGEKTDYSEELEIMKMIWIDRIKEDSSIEFYKK